MNKQSKPSDTDLCVMCGMCLPQCPTYQLYQTEAESPRGRIALIRAIDSGQISAEPKALTHIDHCLGCLNCESICPSKVPYGSIIDEFRDQYSQQLEGPAIAQQVLDLTASAPSLEKISVASQTPVAKRLLKWGSQLSGLPKPLIDTSNIKLANHYPATQTAKKSAAGSITLFTGCTGQISDRATIDDAARLLNHMGFSVNIPETQQCCGGLHKHNGQFRVARQLIDELGAHLAKQTGTATLYFSPACGSVLAQLSNPLIHDIREFLLSRLDHSMDMFLALDRPVVLHESCSNRNMLKAKTLNRDLIKLIPNSHIIESSQPTLCCGAGGLQSINYPAQGEALARAKLNTFDLQHAKYLVSDNIGCTMHMKSFLSEYNPNIEIIHPVSLLARQLKV